jgi:pimeloyl-ACP methyl ester carboxylesterase
MESAVHRRSVILAVVVAVLLPITAPTTGRAAASPGVCGVTQSTIVPGTTPILFVHGINSSHWTWMTGTVTGTSRPPLIYIQDSLRKSNVTGYTFDWAAEAGGPGRHIAWVFDPTQSPDLGGRLSEAIKCVARRAGHKVIIIAHSMGGLLTQYASSIDPTDIAAVFTLGTPFMGSWLASAFGDYSTGVPALSLLADAFSAICLLPVPQIKNSWLCVLAQERDDIGMADMRLAATEGWQSLPPWPTGLRVYSLADSIEGTWRPLWPLKLQLSLTGAGDIASSPSSQRASLPGMTWSCPVRLGAGFSLGTAAAASLLGALAAKPCIHPREPYNKILLDYIIHTIKANHMVPSATVSPGGGQPGPTSALTPSPSPSATLPSPRSRTIQVTVPANAGWVDTGIALTPSDAVRITANGSWTADGVNYTGPDGYSTDFPDNYINLSDLGVCADCATTPYPEWGALMSYTGSAPPQPGSYTSTAVAPQAMLVDYVGNHINAGRWPYSG